MEKVHTPDSLFVKLRERLYKQELVKFLGDPQLKPGDFVEIKLTLHKNPLVETLETVLEIGKTALDVTSQNQDSNQHRPRQRKPATTKASGQSNSRNYLSQVEAVLRRLESSESQGTIDLVGVAADTERTQAVLTIDLAFTSDPTLSDLLDSQYTVLGKVTKKIDKGDDETINLLRKTSLGKAPNLIGMLVETANAMQSSELNLPKPVTEIEGPAIQVIPIAIFV